MSKESKIRIELEALIAEREGMRWENETRLALGNSMAFSVESFFDIARQIRWLLSESLEENTEGNHN